MLVYTKYKYFTDDSAEYFDDVYSILEPLVCTDKSTTSVYEMHQRKLRTAIKDYTRHIVKKDDKIVAVILTIIRSTGPFILHLGSLDTIGMLFCLYGVMEEYNKYMAIECTEIPNSDKGSVAGMVKTKYGYMLDGSTKAKLDYLFKRTTNG